MLTTYPCRPLLSNTNKLQQHRYDIFDHRMFGVRWCLMMDYSAGWPRPRSLLNFINRDLHSFSYFIHGRSLSRSCRIDHGWWRRLTVYLIDNCVRTGNKGALLTSRHYRYSCTQYLSSLLSWYDRHVLSPSLIFLSDQNGLLTFFKTARSDQKKCTSTCFDPKELVGFVNDSQPSGWQQRRRPSITD